MKYVPLLVIVLCALLAIAMAATRRARKGGGVPTRPKPLMTKREQAMYWRLREAFPDAVVLAQVAFAALITSEFKHRNRYDKKIADFVICDPSLRIQVVIELDDASHKGREAKDSARDKLLTNAGYATLRFANVPDVSELRARLQIQLGTTAAQPLQKAPAAAAMAKSP